MNEPKTFVGLDDVGTPFAILYTKNGVRWLRGEDAEPYRSRLLPDGPAAPPSRTSFTGSRAAGTVAQLADAAVAVGNWWEARQCRLLDAAQFEEERRIPWTSDMMARWVAAHADNQHLDLRVSAFLAREATATLAAVTDNKKMAVPQSLLYDLELIRDTVAAGRLVLADQFEALDSSGIGGDLRLDMAFVRRLAEDPLEEWTRRVKGRSADAFDADLREAIRDREKFLALLLPGESARGEGKDRPKGMAAIVGRLAAIPEWPRSLAEAFRDLSAPRRDAFRELALFSAEVTRTTALHSAWGVVEALAQANLGTGLVGVEVDGRLAIATSTKSGSGPEIASARPERMALES